MAGVKVLIEGYVKEEENYELASCTTTLIKENKLKIIVDPGMDRKKLLEALEKENLSAKEIDYIVLTHYHLDHSLLTGIFENAKILDDSNIYSWDGKIKEHEGKVPGTNIKIIKTPGHDPFHCSVLVDTEKGKIAIVADVFWWSDGEEQKIDKKNLMQHKDPYVKNEEKLKESRKKIIEIADWIIPGHGKMFKVNKEK